MRALALGIIVIAVVGNLAGCGDNAKSCGDGTELHNGECIPSPTQPTICGDGTVLNELTNECEPDPSVCGNGTVLIDGHCVDPNTDVTIDVEEGPEPNGFEAGATPAGTIPLKASGSTVVHGCIKPVDNNNPDLDVFLLTTTGPTLLKMTADGVNGLAAGFLVFGDDARLGTWFRLGLNVTTDTSKRELFLPVAGTYEIIMADTRTLLPITTSGTIIPGAGFPAAGNPDGTSCYFVTITPEQLPTAANLDLATGATGTIGEDLKFFTATFPTGIIDLHAVIDPEDIDNDGFPDLDSRAASSLIVMNNNQLRQINDAGGGILPADGPDSEAQFAGIKAGDSAVIVLDYVWNIAAFPVDFSIDVNLATSSQALATDGSVVNATSISQTFDNDVTHLNLFHFDVAGNGEIDGLDITFSKPVTGLVIDQDTLTAVPFTFLDPTRTFTGYKGLIRTRGAGRYYFAVIAPNDPSGTAFTVTSTIVPQTPAAVTLDTPTTAAAFGPFLSDVLTYNAGTEPWQTFDATITGSTPGLTLELFDPTVTSPAVPGFAFGALDKLSFVGSGGPGTKAPDTVPLFARSITNASNASPLILRSAIGPIPAFPTNFLVHVAPQPTAVAADTFSLDFATRIYEDFGGPTITAPAGKTVNSTIAAAGNEQRFYFETTPGNQVSISVVPTGAPALDAVLDILAPDETAATTINAGGVGAAEQTGFVMPASGFVAFRVRGNGASIGNFTLQVNIGKNKYTFAVAPAAFSNACIHGSPVPLVSDGVDPVNVPAADEGLSAAIAPPAGFKLFGATAGDFKVSSNGFLTFNLLIADAHFTHGPLAPDVDIAPLWTDLENVVVCKKTVGTKLIIQWVGDDFTGTNNVQFQAILDGADSSIQFVYGSGQLVNGSNGGGASIGLDDLTGNDSLQIGSDQPLAFKNTSITFTPN